MPQPGIQDFWHGLPSWWRASTYKPSESFQFEPATSFNSILMPCQVVSKHDDSSNFFWSGPNSILTLPKNRHRLSKTVPFPCLLPQTVSCRARMIDWTLALGSKIAPPPAFFFFVDAAHFLRCGTHRLCFVTQEKELTDACVYCMKWCYILIACITALGAARLGLWSADHHLRLRYDSINQPDKHTCAKSAYAGCDVQTGALNLGSMTSLEACSSCSCNDVSKAISLNLAVNGAASRPCKTLWLWKFGHFHQSQMLTAYTLAFSRQFLSP